MVYNYRPSPSKYRRLARYQLRFATGTSKSSLRGERRASEATLDICWDKQAAFMGTSLPRTFAVSTPMLWLRTFAHTSPVIAWEQGGQLLLVRSISSNWFGLQVATSYPISRCG